MMIYQGDYKKSLQMEGRQPGWTHRDDISLRRIAAKLTKIKYKFTIKYFIQYDHLVRFISF